jgi:hypothetical protein
MRCTHRAVAARALYPERPSASNTAAIVSPHILLLSSSISDQHRPIPSTGTPGFDQEALTYRLVSSWSESHPAPPTVQPFPISPNFPKPALTAHIQAEVLSKWPETTASIASNINSAGEHYAALTTLGISNKWVEAARQTALIPGAPSYPPPTQASPLGGAGAPSVRLTQIGSDSPSVRRNFHLDIGAVRYTEVVEFTLSLLPWFTSMRSKQASNCRRCRRTIALLT